MAETRRKFDQDFKEGAVRLVRETGRPIAQVAKDLGINEGTLGNWVNADKRRRGDGTERPSSPPSLRKAFPVPPPRFSVYGSLSSQASQPSSWKKNRHARDTRMCGCQKRGRPPTR